MTAQRRTTTKKKAASNGARPISLMLVDDHPLWREMLRKVLEHKGFAKVVAEASDGTEAIELAASTKLDVVVMDIQLPTMDGIEATRRLVRDRPELKVLVLASSEERTQVLSAVRAGASGYLLKTATSREVADAVRRIRSGELVFPPALADVVLGELRESGAASDKNIFRREGDYWTVSFDGESFLLKDTRGARFLCDLLRSPGREFHALDLVVSDKGSRGLPGSEEGAEILDAEAKASFKRRLSDLAEELEEAESWDDVARAERAREEIDALTEALTKATGLGGRSRKAASPAERARVNVTLAIRGTITKIEEHAPALGEHLRATIKTGVFCSYAPDPRVPISWLT